MESHKRLFALRDNSHKLLCDDKGQTVYFASKADAKKVRDRLADANWFVTKGPDHDKLD
jgi:hypothetical protein